MNISFAIPALNEGRNIARCISSIRQFMPPSLKYEILVGDHGSKDNTVHLAVELGAIVYPVSGGTVGHVRNCLVGHAVGDVIVFVDADVAVTESWGRQIVNIYHDLLSAQDKKITGSFCLPPPSESVFIRSWFQKMSRANTSYLGTGHMILSRTLFFYLGGFDESLRSGEDYDLCKRAASRGAKIEIRDDFDVVHYDYPLSAKEFLLREKWHGIGDFQSWKTIIHSKIALATLVYFFSLIFALLSIFIWPSLFLYFSVVWFFIPILFSCKKFPQLTILDRLKNICIAFLYFSGRSLALISVLFRRCDSAAAV